MRRFQLVFIGFCFYSLVFEAALLAGAAQPQTAAAGAEARVSGLLLGANQLADSGKRVLLIKVRILDENGREIRTLPPKGDTIVDALVTSPAATARTDSSGVLVFKAVLPGRYSVGVTLKPDGAFSSEDVTLLRRVSDVFDTVVFDVASGQDLSLGSLSRKTK